MENSIAGSFAKTAQALSDKTINKAQGGIRSAQDAAKDAGDLLSHKIEDVRSEAGTVVNRGSKRVQAASKQGLGAVTDKVDSIAQYAKSNPVKGLAIAAASGAALYVIVKALTQRD